MHGMKARNVAPKITSLRLASVTKSAESRRPWAVGEFRAVGLSLGVLLERDSADELVKWKRYDGMIKRVSLVLSRAGAKLYEG